MQESCSLPRVINVKVRHLVVKCCYFEMATALDFLLLLLLFFYVAERTFEDHENLVEPLLAWTRDSENQILFQERREKNEVFKNPQVRKTRQDLCSLGLNCSIQCVRKVSHNCPLTELLPLEERQEIPEGDQEQRQRAAGTGMTSGLSSELIPQDFILFSFCRKTSAAPRSSCPTWKQSCTSRKTARSHGNSDSSS